MTRGTDQGTESGTSWNTKVTRCVSFPIFSDMAVHNRYFVAAADWHRILPPTQRSERTTERIAEWRVLCRMPSS